MYPWSPVILLMVVPNLLYWGWFSQIFQLSTSVTFVAAVSRIKKFIKLTPNSPGNINLVIFWCWSVNHRLSDKVNQRRLPSLHSLFLTSSFCFLLPSFHCRQLRHLDLFHLCDEPRLWRRLCLELVEIHGPRKLGEG